MSTSIVDRCRDLAMSGCQPATGCIAAVRQSQSSPLCSICNRFKVYKLPVQSTDAPPPTLPFPIHPPQFTVLRPAGRQSVSQSTAKQNRLHSSDLTSSCGPFDVLESLQQISHCIHVHLHATCGIIVCCIRMAFHGQHIAVFQAFRQGR